MKPDALVLPVMRFFASVSEETEQWEPGHRRSRFPVDVTEIHHRIPGSALANSVE